MKKRLALFILPFFTIVSLHSAVIVEQDVVNQKINFNIKINSREDLFQTVDALQNIIPLIYQSEIGADEVKKDVIVRLSNHLDSIANSTSIRSLINQLTNSFLEINRQEGLSFSDSLILLAQNLKTIEDAHVFSALHSFLLSSEGSLLLQLLEECRNNQIKQVPLFLLLFYVLREASYGLENESNQHLLELL